MPMKQSVLQAKRLEVWTCTRDATLGEVAQRMVEEDISCLVVVDDQEYLHGIITRTDLLRALICCDDWESHPVEDYMVQDVVTVQPAASLEEVAHILLEKQIHRVVVVRQEENHLRPMSVVSSADLVYHMVKSL